MSLSKSSKCYIKLILASTVLLALFAWASAGCTGFDQWAPQPAEEEKTEAPAAPTTITTHDRAILAVYEHLFSQAESYQAKTYLADFYTSCDNWTAESEMLKDGTNLWYVIVDMSRVATWEEKAYWQQAAWLVHKDGEVIPSTRFQANALRIEADLEQLSLQPPPSPAEPEG
jgi:hypothetical protein